MDAPSSTEFWSIAIPAIKAGTILRADAEKLAMAHKPGRSADSHWAKKIDILRTQIVERQEGRGLPRWEDEASKIGIKTMAAWTLYRGLQRAGPAAVLDRQAQRAILSVKYGLATAIEELQLLNLVEVVRADRHGIAEIRLKEGPLG